jgi:hypothetical protein
MDKQDLTAKHILPVFVILFMFVLMASRGEGKPGGGSDTISVRSVGEWPRKSTWLSCSEV